MAFLTVSGIIKRGEGSLVLDAISFSQRKRENIAVIGETGSGKSTLLKIIAGLVQPDKGTVVFENKLVDGPSKTLVAGHPAICYLSQDFELPKVLTIEQILRYANKLSTEDADFVYRVCLIDHLLKRKSDELSGGERQRIAMARLLTSSPRLMLLDEAFSNLDRAHKITMKKILEEIGRKLDISFILISHDPEDILSWAHKILVLKDGRIIQKGTPEKIYAQPHNEYTAGLLGTFTTIDTKVGPFSGVRSLKTTRKLILLRGEQFKVGSRRKNAIQGKVIQVRFLGSYYEIEINCSGTIVIAKTQNCAVAAGDSIYVSIRDQVG
jgi:ABC-type Fe3+/spermidine/putrescine transport system ATPase subunit